MSSSLLYHAFGLPEMGRVGSHEQVGGFMVIDCVSWQRSGRIRWKA
jgi:hypothetical protein